MSTQQPNSGAPEVVVPFKVPRDQITPATRVRSTLLASSLRALRDRGMFDAYAAKLDPQWRAPILEAVAGVWLPLEAGLAHYRACDALGFSASEQVEIGRAVGDRVHGTFLATMIRTAKNAGVTPWTAVGYSGKLYERLFEGGGGCEVTKIGPKDARSELVNNPILGIAYFRNGLRGLYQAGVELFCRKAYVNELTSGETSAVLKISWA